ncbi:MAG TPA: hypothetical protein VFY45_20175 [Baekduia sp.]|nr:hypothetical protein [Baekduia sp.]
MGKDGWRATARYLIRSPRGLTARRHEHSLAHTIVVLDGALPANGRTLGPGGYRA